MEKQTAKCTIAEYHEYDNDYALLTELETKIRVDAMRSYLQAKGHFLTLSQDEKTAILTMITDTPISIVEKIRADLRAKMKEKREQRQQPTTTHSIKTSLQKLREKIWK